MTSFNRPKQLWDCDLPPNVCNCKNHTFIHILDHYEVIYVETPKCASASIKAVLRDLCRDGESDATWDELADESFREKVEDYYTFTVVRPPWERIASYYLMCKRNLEYNSHDPEGQIFYEYYGEVPNYERFLQDIGRLGYRNHHLEPLTKFFPFNISQFSDIIHLRNLEEKWKDIPVPAALPHKNSNQQSDYEEYYGSWELERRMRDKYKKEIELFTYNIPVELDLII